mgnify:CR=1 FL=1
MTIPELTMYIEILTDYYGEDYITNFDQLSELLLIDMDITCSPKELAKLFQMKEDTEDLMLNLRVCGIII